MAKVPQSLFKTPLRRDMWRNAQRVIHRLEKVLPIKAIYLRGSFASRKKRPADVDLIILLKTKGARKKSKWSVDFVVCPDNQYGSLVLEDASKWMKQKYGAKKAAFIKLK